MTFGLCFKKERERKPKSSNRVGLFNNKSKMNIAKIMIACAVIGLIVSCQKETETPIGGTSSAGTQKAYRTRWFVYNETTHLAYCTFPSGNCLDDVVVSRLMAPAIDNVWAAVLSGDQTRITGAFTTESTTLTSFMDQSDYDGVIGGTHQATGQVAAPGDVPERYLLIHKSGAIVSAYPLLNKP